MDENSELVKAAIKESINFILSSQKPDGSWRDFTTSSAGESIDWTTAYIGFYLSQSLGIVKELDTNITTSIDKAINLLLKNINNQGGWGYNTIQPSDADTTSWVLIFLLKNNFRDKGTIDRIKNFLLNHRLENGAFSTYTIHAGLEKFFAGRNYRSFEGWYHPHMCVVPNIVIALSLCSSKDDLKDSVYFIKNAQDTNGSWKSYWWHTDLYSTYLCTKALMLYQEDFGNSLDKTYEFLNNITPDGKETDFPFKIALKIKSLLSFKNSFKGIEKEINSLIKSQLDDGSWESSALLNISDPSIKNPWLISQEDKIKNPNLIRPRKDQNRLFTTATCLSALVDYYRSISLAKS